MVYPHKPAPTDLPVLEAIKERWSPVGFSDKPVEDEKLQTMFEAARWAPSSYNEQPWRYLYALNDGSDERAVLESLLMEGNAWAKNASVLLISFAKKTSSKNGKPNRMSMHDLGASNALLAVQLPSLGLVGHQMGGFFAEKANDVLGVPDDFEAGSMMAIGYPADESSLSDDLLARQQAPRVRNTLDSFVFCGQWKG